MSDIITIRWCPKDALDGMQMLDAMEELAYRRIIDLIYVTGDNLPDDDKKLAWMTKTGREWKRIKASLIQQGKIEVSEHKIVQRKCQLVLKETREYIDRQSNAGKASAEKRKHQKNNNSPPTAVITERPTEHITNTSTEHPTARQVANSHYPVSKKSSSSERIAAQGDDDDLIKIFDEEFKSVFGYDRSKRRHDDAKHARAFGEAGANAEFFRSLCREVMQLLKAGDNDAPTGLVYFASIVPEALAKAMRLNGEAVHAVQPIVVTLDTLGGDTPENRGLLTMFEIIKQQLGEPVWRSWISGLRIADHQGETLRLAASTRFIATWVTDNYAAALVSAAQTIWPEISAIEVQAHAA